jgi:hypothetical protein
LFDVDCTGGVRLGEGLTSGGEGLGCTGCGEEPEWTPGEVAVGGGDWCCTIWGGVVILPTFAGLVEAGELSPDPLMRFWNWAILSLMLRGLSPLSMLAIIKYQIAFITSTHSLKNNPKVTSSLENFHFQIKSFFSTVLTAGICFMKSRHSNENSPAEL